MPFTFNPFTGHFDISPPSIWKTYTPTINNGGTTSSLNGWYRREGDSVHIRGDLTATGAGSGSVLSVTIPSGFSVDTSKVGAINAAVLGPFKGNIGGNIYVGVCVNAGSGNISFCTTKSTASALLGNVLANGDIIGWDALIPIVGWNT